MQSAADRFWLLVQGVRDRPWLRRLLLVAFPLLGAGVLGWILAANWAVLTTYPWSLRPGLLALAVLTYLADLALAVLAWSGLMALLASPMPYWRHWRIYCLTLIASRLPGVPWHVAGRAVLYAQAGVSLRVTSLAAGLEMLLMVIAGLLVGLLVSPALLQATGMPWQFSAVLLLACLVLAHPASIRFMLKRLGISEAGAYIRVGQIMWLLLLYAALWVVGGIVTYFTINSLVPLPVADLFTVIGAWSLSGVISMVTVFTPSGLGIREITFSALLSLVLPASVAVVAALSMRILLTVLEIMMALMAARTRQNDTPAHDS